MVQMWSLWRLTWTLRVAGLCHLMSTVLVTYWLLSLLSVSVKILYFVVGAIYPHRAESVVESQSISHYSLFHSQHFLTVHAKLPIFSCHVAFTANIFEPTVTLCFLVMVHLRQPLAWNFSSETQCLPYVVDCTESVLYRCSQWPYTVNSIDRNQNVKYDALCSYTWLAYLSFVCVYRVLCTVFLNIYFTVKTLL